MQAIAILMLLHGLHCQIDYPAGHTYFVAPLASGTVVATCAARGTLSLSGPAASSFAVSGNQIVVGNSSITTGGEYDITVKDTF
jgi:hypothetical protein